MSDFKSQTEMTAAPEGYFPQVYGELRKPAAAKLMHERAGHTLDATALVHEAYLKLGADTFTSRSGFFRAAAEAMRRILVDHARAKHAEKRGGDLMRMSLPDVAAKEPAFDLLALDEALTTLEQHDQTAAELVKLRYFSGLTHTDAAEALGLTRRQADGLWALARAWLYRSLESSS